MAINSTSPTPRQRVIIEKRELDRKISKLKEFTLTRMVGLSKPAKKLLIKQFKVMKKYSKVLGKRLEIWKEV